DLQRPALGSQVFLARVDLQGVAEGAEQVGDRHRPILRRGAVRRAGADDPAALDPGAGQRYREAARVVIAAGVAVDPRRPPELAPAMAGAEAVLLLRRVDRLGAGAHHQPGGPAVDVAVVLDEPGPAGLSEFLLEVLHQCDALAEAVLADAARQGDVGRRTVR